MPLDPTTPPSHDLTFTLKPQFEHTASRSLFHFASIRSNLSDPLPPPPHDLIFSHLTLSSLSQSRSHQAATANKFCSLSSLTLEICVQYWWYFCVYLVFFVMCSWFGCVLVICCCGDFLFVGKVPQIPILIRKTNWVFLNEEGKLIRWFLVFLMWNKRWILGVEGKTIPWCGRKGDSLVWQERLFFGVQGKSILC